MKKIMIPLVLLAVLLTACQNAGESGDTPATQAEAEDVSADADTEQVDIISDWKEVTLKDVRTGEAFKVSDFDKPVLLESFAVWCPTCTKQQNQIKELHEELGDSVVSITIDTDPNEEESQVLDHVERNGFDWLYAVAPVEMTQSLIDQFGVNIVNAPSAPVILICDSHTELLQRGVKSADELKTALEVC